MITFKQKNYAIPLLAGAAMGKVATGLMVGGTVAGTGISAVQGHNANKEAEEQTEEMQRHNKQMEKIAREQAQQEQKNFGAIPAGFLNNAKGLAKDILGKEGLGMSGNLKKAAGFGAGMAGLGYVGNRAAQSWKDHDEGNDKANKNFLLKAGATAAAIGGGIWAAKAGKLGTTAQNFMSKEGMGGKALSSLGKAVNPIVRNEAGDIKKGATLGKVALNGSFAAMPVLGYAAQRGQQKDQVENQVNYSESGENGSGIGKKVLSGLAVAGTVAGGIHGARRGIFGAGAQKAVGNKLAQTGSYLQNFKATKGIGDKLITSGADAFATGQTKKVADMMKNANKSFDATKFKNNLEMSRVNRALETPASLKKGASETVGGAMNWFGMMGTKSGTGAVQRTANKLAESNNSWSRAIGEHMQKHKNLANLEAGGAALAGGLGAMTVGEKAVKAVTGTIDSDAYKMEKEQNQKVYSETTKIKTGVRFFPKTGKKIQFKRATTKIDEPGYKELSETVIEKSYTQYDETDQLKMMKDSDILAEKKRKTSSLNLGTSMVGAGVGAGVGAMAGKLAGKTGTGALIGTAVGGMAGMDSQTREKTGIGAAIGSVAGGLLSMKVGRGFKSGAMLGGALGGTAGVAAGIASGHKQNKENQFFNDRLEQAQRQATRREKKDWKNNITNREGYTY